MTERPTQLRRSLSTSQVALYGLGNILGAGIYVLIGEIAGIAGGLAPFAFLLAASVAALTAFTFAEFSSRYPMSGGAALYVHRGFNRPKLTLLVGILMVTTGIVSSATITRGFVGYLDVFVDLPPTLTIVVLV
ncbi:MAG: amino acid permease, partial [Pseudomonadales bacterium]|nr:amino acid permease [Pseudomonadales bacterium]